MIMATSGSPVTVVLVHGAFADASSWAGVVGHLLEAGVAAQAVPNPLRGLTSDGEYVASLLSQIDGSVVLVGHSYGGPVITYASAKAPNVRALVFVASFGLDQGVSTLGSVESFPASELNTALQPRSYPDGNGGAGTEFYIQPDKFHSVFAADLADDQAATLAVSQRPAADVAFGEPLGVEPGWKHLPSWFVIAGNDHAINPDAAQLLGATAVEIEGASHAVALSHSQKVSEIILDAIAAARQG
jgi:pimeloyl-ACP methyl ester carboxylesterase